MSTENADIEAYVQTAGRMAVASALSECTGLLSLDGPPEGEAHIYQAEGVFVVLQPSENGFLRVWVRGSSAWTSCAALGRHLANGLSSVVRCDLGDEFLDVSPYSNVFLEILSDGERLFL